jgi:hypothetical protein
MLIFDQLEQMFANLNKLVQICPNMSKFVQVGQICNFCKVCTVCLVPKRDRKICTNLHKFAQVCCSLLPFALLLVLYIFKKLPKLDKLAKLV